MLFNSIDFLVFFVIVCFIFFIQGNKYRWLTLLSASYYFYMCWQPAYAILILFTTLVSFSIAILSEGKSSGVRQKFLWLSLLINLGVLFFFKYFNFTNQILKESLHLSFGISYEFDGFDILLPIGISFYTFQTISYNLDVYYNLRKPEKHFGIFALYVSFFPQLIAGPIERSTALLPQFRRVTNFSWDRFQIGLKYMIWGFFKKLVISDRLSVYVDTIYGNSDTYHGAALLFATFLFSFQLYCDFSAYSDIAKGAAKILGYDLMENFNHPFSSKNITEFWRKWHISLSTWLRDYLFTPLSFRFKRWRRKAVILALLITFLLCGLWHGAKLTFMVFGILQASALIYELMTIKIRKKIQSRMNEKIYSSISTLLTFCFMMFCFIFFRAENIDQAFEIVQKLVSHNYQTIEIMNLIGNSKWQFTLVFSLLIAFILLDKKIFSIVKEESKLSVLKEQLLFGTLIALTVMFGFYGEVEFIYFQF